MTSTRAVFTSGVLSLVVAAVLASALPAQAQLGLPSLTVKNAGRDELLELRSVAVSVQLEGWMAETVLELEFFNHTNRRQEGEFVLQLPEGATVSTYALDIQGKMRPGVAVEKEKARRAYESIKRRQVDPGLVEREAGNVYRTRIFPVESKQPKRVRIGFIHTLGDDGEYALPLRHREALKSFTCQVSGAREAPALTSEGLDEAPSVAGFQAWAWEAKDVKLGGVLRAASLLPEEGDKPRVRLQSQPDGGVHFLVQGRRKRPAEGGADEALDPQWKKVRLLWDTSLSGGWRDHEAEIVALRRLWHWIGDGEVRLQMVGLKLGAAEVYPIRDGECAALEEELRGASYDGAGDFSSIVPWAEGVTLLVGDGRLSSPAWDLKDELALDEFFLLDSSGRTAGGSGDDDDPTLLSGAALRIDLTDQGWLKTLTDSAEGIRVGRLGHEAYDVSVAEKTFAISGRLAKGFRGEVQIRVPGEKEIEFDPADAELDERAENGDEWTFLRRIWAQRHLASLERRGTRAQITEFSEAERLVSDYTSLIVLELMTDHVRYRIPPPEPVLRDEYERRIENQLQTGIQSSPRLWRQKVDWHRTEFPWLDVDLSTEVATVAIWVKAARTAFPPEKLNQRELEPYEKWLAGARQVVAGKDSLKSSVDYHAWMAQLEVQLGALGKIRDQPAVKKDGDPLHVSVRGFVHERGIYSAKPGESLMLREAIESAGGPAVFGAWSRVYLYRDGRRTGYNMDSRLFEAMPLNWGDMVVMEREPRRNYSERGPVDPFSAAGGSDAPSSPSEQGPVFEDSASARMSTAPTFLNAGGTGRRDTGTEGDDADGQGLYGTFVDDGTADVPMGRDQKVIDAIRAHADPEKAYREWLGGVVGKENPSVATVIEIARLFFERQQIRLGEAVLTNLMELSINPVEATRSYAYWLAEFGRVDRAVSVLQTMAATLDDDDAATRALVHFDAGRIAGDAEYFFSAAASDPLADESRLLTIALTDYFALGGNPRGAVRAFQAHPMASDVRIVVSWAGGQAGPVISEPDLLADDIDHGGWIMRGDRVHEYQMRRALPGKYQVKMHRRKAPDGPLTVRVDYYLNWGEGQETTRQSKTVLMEAWQLDLPDLEFAWGDEAEPEGESEPPAEAKQR